MRSNVGNCLGIQKSGLVAFDTFKSFPVVKLLSLWRIRSVGGR